MEDWKDCFKEQNLEKAAKYRVYSLNKEADGSYTGRVQTTVMNHVTITRSKYHLEGKCSCNRKDNNGFCIHMASMCLEIERQDPDFLQFFRRWTADEQLSPKTDPFSSKAGSGCVFDTKKIFSKSVIVTEAMVKAAEEFIAEGRVSEFRVSVADEGRSSRELSSRCCIEDHGTAVTVSLSIRDNEIRVLQCDVPEGENICDKSDLKPYRGWGYYSYYSYKNTPCIHKLVLCLLTARYIWENDPGDATDINADKLMKFVAESRQIFRPDFSAKRETSVQGQIVDIVPIYNIKENRLSFTVGAAKQYVVKDFTDLPYYYRNKSSMKLGKNNTIDFAVDTLTKRAEYVMTMLSHIRYPESRKYITVERSMFDILHNLAEEVEVLNENGAVLEAIDSPARLDYEFHVSKHNGEENRISVTINFPRRGNEAEGYGYLVKDNKIIRMNLKELGQMYPLVPSMEPYTVKFIFGRSRIPEFYNSVLPLLEQYGDVRRSLFSGSSRWAVLIPSFSFYLDYHDDIITCEAHMVLDGSDTVLNPGLHSGITEHSDVKWIKSQLNVLFTDYCGELWMTDQDNTDELYTLLRDGIPVLMSLGEVNISDSLKNISVRKPSVINADVTFDNDLLELDIETKDMTGEELLALLASYRLRKRYHRLKDGSFIDLAGDCFEDFADVAESLNLTDDQIRAGHAEFSGYRALYLDHLLEGRKNIVTDRDSAFRKMVRDFSGFRESETEVPSSLAATMRPYQKDGFRWLRTLYDYRFGGILADEMGLGKTLQVISLMLSLKESGEEGTHLVVCPSSLVYNWEAELMKFAPSLRTCVMAGLPEERKNLIISLSEYDVVITSYDLLKRDITLYKDKKFHLLIIDEAQYVKNQGTGASKTVKVLNAKVRFALTGTPIENRLSEIWSIFDFLMPGFLYSYERFRRDVELPVMKKNDKKASDKLKSMVSPFILRRLKTDVLRDLPEKLEEVSYSEMTDGQRKLYDAKVLQVRQDVESADEASFRTNKLMILSELTRLRQICCDPALVFENYNEGSGKLESTMELIERAIDEGHRMLVFSQFTTMLSRIASRLDKSDIRYYTITGETPKSERLRLVEGFNNGKTPVFLISLRAGGTGLNLTGADVVIHYDPWWNAAVQDQATDRAHRIGQTRVVTVYSMIAKNTIEDKIIKMQERKKDLADEVLAGEATGLSSLTREDLLEMLS